MCPVLVLLFMGCGLFYFILFSSFFQNWKKISPKLWLHKNLFKNQEFWWMHRGLDHWKRNFTEIKKGPGHLVWKKYLGVCIWIGRSSWCSTKFVSTWKHGQVGKNCMKSWIQLNWVQFDRGFFKFSAKIACNSDREWKR